jgi:hypothetical protein
LCWDDAGLESDMAATTHDLQGAYDRLISAINIKEQN